MARRQPLQGLRFSVTKRLTEALKECANALEEKIVENVSLDDHTADELARLGYPYARRAPQSLHSPDYQVHVQSGRLVNAVGQVQINQYAIDVGVDESQAPEVVHVLYGTSKMIARDFITGSYNEVRARLTEIMERALRRGVDEA